MVGFYGGINYGYGYTGRGYEGGYWRNGAFFYNRAVNNVNTTNITNVYNKTVINNVTVNNVSYNGGNRGTTARATGAEMAAEHGRRVPPTAEQRRHVEVARGLGRVVIDVVCRRRRVAVEPRRQRGRWRLVLVAQRQLLEGRQPGRVRAIQRQVEPARHRLLLAWSPMTGS